MPLFVAFDNEEVGSLTKQRADSTFLEDTIERISKALEIDEDKKHKIQSKYFALTVDNAHADHPIIQSSATRRPMLDSMRQSSSNLMPTNPTPATRIASLV
jgi:aspartyl aminopeptidase